MPCLPVVEGARYVPVRFRLPCAKAHRTVDGGECGTVRWSRPRMLRTKACHAAPGVGPPPWLLSFRAARQIPSAVRRGDRREPDRPPRTAPRRPAQAMGAALEGVDVVAPAIARSRSQGKEERGVGPPVVAACWSQLVSRPLAGGLRSLSALLEPGVCCRCRAGSLRRFLAVLMSGSGGITTIKHDAGRSLRSLVPGWSVRRSML